MTGKTVNIIPEATKVETLNENGTSIKVICVTPRSDTEKCSRYDKECNKNVFCYETRYKPEGKKSKGTGQKISYLIETKYKFPYLVTRQEILQIKHVVHSAIKVATDDIKKRIDAFKEAIEKKPFDFSKLESILTGSVLALVNGGIKNYFDDFYNDETIPSLDEKEVEEFEKILDKFMKTSNQGIEIYLKHLIKTNQMEEKKIMYETLSLYYQNTCKLVYGRIKIDK